jgi:hypothetical protein
VFKELKDKLMTAPILKSADMSQPFEIQTDGSQTGTGVVLQQRDDNGVTRPVAYMSHKLNAAEQNYPTHDREVLAIVQALKLWRPYLLGHHFMVLTDHNPLRHLQTQSILSQRQARRVLAMQEFDFEFKYLQGKANGAADALSRKETKQIQPTWDSLRMDKWKATLPLLTIDIVQYDTHMISQLLTEYLQDSKFAKQFQSPKAPYAIRDGRLYRDGPFCVPNGSLRGILLHDHHDAVTASHRGATKTIKTLQHQYYWGSLAKDVRDQVRTCAACQRAKSDRRRRAGLFTPHAPPMTKWSEVSIDFMFELAETDSGNTGLAVVVDKLSKQAHFLPLKPNFSAQDLAYVFIQEIYRHHSLPSKIISDRDARFTSKFSSTLHKLLGTKLNISTAFHPETDGQSRRAFGVFQEMIRPFVDVLQRDWDTHIAQLEFAYNNTVNDSTGQTHFYVASGQHPPTLYDALRQAQSVQDAEVNTAAKYFVSEAQRAMDAARKALMDTNITLTKRINKSWRHVVYDIGDKVMLSTVKLKLPIGSSRVKKFTSRFLGPFTVTDIVANGLAYTFKLPPHKGLHPTFHVGLLKP